MNVDMFEPTLHYILGISEGISTSQNWRVIAPKSQKYISGVFGSLTGNGGEVSCLLEQDQK
jgi:hypothetical protein